MPEKPDIEIVGYGFTQEPPDSIGNSYLTYAVVVKNNSTTRPAASISINIAFTNAAGTVVKAADDNVNVLLPGQTAATAESSVAATGVMKMTAQALPQGFLNPTESVGSFSAEGINTTQQQYLGFKTNCILKSTFIKDLRQVYAAAVYYNAANQVIGGGFTFVDFVPAGGQAAVEIPGPKGLPGLARTDVFANVSNLTTLNP